MSLLDAARHRIRTWFDREQLAREMEAEVRFHLELDAMQNPDSPGRRFGHVPSVGADRRAASGLATFDRLGQDLSYATRQLRRAPAFAAGVILTLALGIGANVTMFAVVDHVMLRAPSGIAHADRVVQLQAWETRQSSRDTEPVFSFPSFAEFRSMTSVFDAVLAVTGPLSMSIGRGPDAARARVSTVAGDYFGTLGVRPIAGRFFAPDETDERATALVAVISYGYWQLHFGGAADAIGRSIAIGTANYTIIGVASPEFAGHNLNDTDLWIPIAPSRRAAHPAWATERGLHFLMIIARLRPGITLSEAAPRVAAGWTAWNLHPEAAGSHGPTPFFTSLIPAENQGRPEYRVARVLTIVSLLIFLVACANVANLQLTRALSRQREIAIRLALGVTRARLAGLVLVDMLVLAILGGVAAVAVAHWGIPIVRATLFGGSSMADWEIDGRLLAFTAVAAGVATLLSGIVPAIQATSPSLVDALKTGTREGGVPRSWVRSALVVAQGALTVALLVGTGLFVRSLQRVGAEHVGLDLDRLLVVTIPSHWADLPRVEWDETYTAMQAVAARVPGVESASLSVGVPFLGQYATMMRLPGHDSLPGMRRDEAPFLYAVTPEFFHTMGTRILRGRALTDADNATAPAVAVVNAEMARQFWPDENPLGQCFMNVPDDTARPPVCTRVVGVAEDARRAELIESAPALQYYIPLPQVPPLLYDPSVLVRASRPDEVQGRLQVALQRSRPDLPFVQVRPLADLVAPELRPWKLGASIFGLFGGLALAIAAVGMYTVARFNASQRTREMAVRVALGAGTGRVIRLVVGEALRSAAIASAAGLGIALVGGRFIHDLLFHTSPEDPSVFVTVVALLLSCAVCAAAVPAWRASRVDPAATLKSD